MTSMAAESWWACGGFDSRIDGSFSIGRHELKESLLVAAISRVEAFSIAEGRRSKPAWACFADGGLIAHYAEPVALEQRCEIHPWLSWSGGTIWSLPSDTAVDHFIEPGHRPQVSSMIAVADGLMVDLELVGSLILSGDGREVAAVVELVRAQFDDRPGAAPFAVVRLNDCPDRGAAHVRVVVGPGAPGQLMSGTGIHLMVGWSRVQPGTLLDVSSLRFPATNTAAPAVRPLLRATAPSRVSAEPDAGLGSDGLSLGLLGPIEAAFPDAEHDLTSQQLSLVTYLACTGPVDGTTIIDALWAGEAISASRFPNLIAELRARIGRQHLPRAVGGTYRIEGVRTDFERLEAVVGHQARRPDRPTADLIDALELVRGVPLSRRRGKHWHWIDHHPMRMSMEAMVSDGAYWVAEVCLQRGDLEAAKTACERGLLSCPHDERLVLRLIDALLGMGRFGAAVRQVDSWEARMRTLGYGEPPSGPRDAVRSLRGGSVATLRSVRR